MDKMSFLQRIVNLFFTPSKAFDGLAEGVSYKDWLYPLIIVTMGMIILPLVFRDVSINEAEERFIRIERSLSNNPDIPEERLEQVNAGMRDAREKITDSREHPFAFRNLWGYLLIPVMYFISAAFFSAVLMLVGNFGMGGKVKFFQMFTMVILTYLIGGNGFLMNMAPGVGTLELLVKAPLIAIKESTDMIFSPGLIFEEIDTYLKHFLNQLDVFRIWGMVVMGFGFAKLYNKPTSSGIVAVGMPWLILVAIGAALVKANSLMMG